MEQNNQKAPQRVVTNIRDRKTGASVLPQYNLLNLGYRMVVQIFERIEKEQYPAYISRYMQKNMITKDRLMSQQRLIADLLDGLFAKEYSRDSNMSYLRKAMQDCNWSDRFDWEAMAVFDMLASQSMLAYYFGAIADLITESEITAQNSGELREIVDRMCRESLDNVHGRVTQKESKEWTPENNSSSSE